MDLFRELPQEHARPGFTARVLEQLDAKPRRLARRSFRLAPALAAITVLAVAVAVAAGALIEWRSGARKHQEAVQALKELREEHGRLAAELHEMSQPPVVYLGGDEKVDYVLDLGKIRNAEVVASAAPTAYHIDTF
jgi:hypothetical protein